MHGNVADDRSPWGLFTSGLEPRFWAAERTDGGLNSCPGGGCLTITSEQGTAGRRQWNLATELRRVINQDRQDPLRFSLDGAACLIDALPAKGGACRSGG